VPAIRRSAGICDSIPVSFLGEPAGLVFQYDLRDVTVARADVGMRLAAISMTATGAPPSVSPLRAVRLGERKTWCA
jgi:hypothetical protein